MPAEGKLLEEIAAAFHRLRQAVAESEFWHGRRLAEAQDQRKQALAQSQTTFKRVEERAEAAHAPQIHSAEERYQEDILVAERRNQGELATLHQAFEEALTSAQSDSAAAVEPAGLAAAAWDDPGWSSWAPPVAGVPPFVRLGQLVETANWDRLVMPTMLPVIGGRSLLIEAGGAPKVQAAQAVQALMLRLLATTPAGKLHFTLVDPVGLGQNVAAFMHLADYDPELIDSRFWTEPRHIEERLARLTEQIETVNGKYLRNQFETIEAYNRAAGEVEEPYRVLVVFDFPVNFSPDAARRLVSIAQNGPRCGVYAIVLRDPDKPLPHGFSRDDLALLSNVVAWRDQRFAWDRDELRECKLELDGPPNNELLDRIVKTTGREAKQASRVEVSVERMFELFNRQVAAQPERYAGIALPLKPDDRATWWRGSTVEGLIAPLGRAGATGAQCLELGRPNVTTHNALVAGRVGSGKSTLLHTAIASLALTYSPVEVELYLIDFKEGVEFKTYARHELPHARVVAIETDPEFGLSVLQGLAAELERRAELFKSASDRFGTSVPGLSTYRALSGAALPRILLIVDEFQRFFDADDAIARQSAQALDHLARQGRAFGIHLLLCSQTLAGVYTLHRATMGQMAVRIALQCGEADSRLILAEDNPSARLLSRPGEAIYNDKDGLLEGDSRFQGAYLSDERREQLLEAVSSLAAEQRYRPPKPPIVFEGNVPAEVEKNRPLQELLEGGPPSAPPRGVRAWLGEPTAIRDPVAAVLRRQSGSNLLIVGQNEQAARAMVAIALVSLAAQLAARTAAFPALPRFSVLDFGAADAPEAELLADLAGRLPHKARLGRRLQLPGIVADLAAEVQRRIDEDDSTAPSLFLVVHGLQRARDLRPDDSLGYRPPGAREAPPTPAQQFAQILKDGPDVGVHSLLWCDTLVNLNRVLDRRAQREFALRVVFQMSVEDSNNLIDSRAAGQLGPNRALFWDEDDGRLEKLRPYATPSPAWLNWAIERLRPRSADTRV